MCTDKIRRACARPGRQAQIATLKETVTVVKGAGFSASYSHPGCRTHEEGVMDGDWTETEVVRRCSPSAFYNTFTALENTSAKSLRHLPSASSSFHHARMTPKASTITS